MVDIISLCRHLREKFFSPENYAYIYDEMKSFLKTEPDQQTELDAYRALVAKWKRDGWVWENMLGAVMPLKDEKVEFDVDEGIITLTLYKGSSTLSTSLAYNEHHDRIVWFDID